MMRFREITSLLLLLSLVLTLFTSCKSNPDASDMTTSEVPDTAQNSAEPRTDFEKYMSKIEVPFPNAFSPFIYGDSLYFSAAKMGAADLLQNMLIRYDMNTKESEIIFDLSNKRCIIQSISANENWLVWSVSEEFGSYCDAYIKNLKTGKINKIYSRTYEAAAWIVPCLMGDCVYWIEEQEYSDGRISGAVIKYDCLTNTRTELQKLHEIGLYSLNLHANDGMLIWTDVLSDGAYYFLHNIKSGETISFKAKRRIAGYVQYANGLIFSTEFDDFEIGPAYSCVIDVKTKEYLEPNNLFRLSSIKRVSGNFLASKADGINVFKIEDTTIKYLGSLPGYASNFVYTSQPDFFTTTKLFEISDMMKEDFRNKGSKLYIFDLRELLSQ